MHKHEIFVKKGKIAKWHAVLYVLTYLHLCTPKLHKNVIKHQYI